MVKQPQVVATGLHKLANHNQEIVESTRGHILLTL